MGLRIINHRGVCLCVCVCVCIRSHLYCVCLCATRSWSSGCLSKNKAQPLQVTMQIRTLWQPVRTARVRILCQVLLFDSWLPVAAAAVSPLSLRPRQWSWYWLTCGLRCYSNQSPAWPHPCVVCRRWLIVQIFKWFFFSLFYYSVTLLHCLGHVLIFISSIAFVKKTQFKGGMNEHSPGISLCLWVAQIGWSLLALPDLSLPTAILYLPHQPRWSSILWGSASIYSIYLQTNIFYNTITIHSQSF